MRIKMIYIYSKQGVRITTEQADSLLNEFKKIMCEVKEASHLTARLLNTAHGFRYVTEIENLQATS